MIATTATKLSFHELTPGKHHIDVMLAGNDHKPLGPSKSLDLEVPSSDYSHRRSVVTEMALWGWGCPLRAVACKRRAR